MSDSRSGLADPRAVVTSTEDPAFGTDERGRIVVWNTAAEQLLGYTATDVVGRRCSGVIRGRDVFGNVYCTEHCNPREMAQCGTGIRRFVMDVCSASGAYIRAGFSNICLQGPGREYTLVHVIHPDVGRMSWDHSVLDDRSAFDSLTRREAEVLRLLAEGGTTRQIAEHLCISPATVRKHTQSVLAKLDAHSRLEAVSLALRHHFI